MKTDAIHIVARHHTFIRILFCLLLCTTGISHLSAQQQADTLLELTREQADSLEFRFAHHYTVNYNFSIKADSLPLVSYESDIIDTCYLRKGDIVAVAEIRQQSPDTVWIKVFRDQLTMGWVPESVLLDSATPDDGISKILDRMTWSRGVWMSILILLGVVGFMDRRNLSHRLQVFRFAEMDRFFPICFLFLIAILAITYSCIQAFTPEYWQEYYFHPTLNPFILPTLMGCLVGLVWLIIIIFIALIIEVYENFYFRQGITYLLEIVGMAMAEYLILSLVISLAVSLGR